MRILRQTFSDCPSKGEILLLMSIIHSKFVSNKKNREEGLQIHWLHFAVKSVLIESLWEELTIIIVLNDFASGIKTLSNNEQEGNISTKCFRLRSFRGSFTLYPFRYKSIQAKFCPKIKKITFNFYHSNICYLAPSLTLPISLHTVDVWWLQKLQLNFYSVLPWNSLSTLAIGS